MKAEIQEVSDIAWWKWALGLLIIVILGIFFFGVGQQLGIILEVWLKHLGF